MSGITFREENTSGQFAQRWRERDLSYKSCNSGRGKENTSRQFAQDRWDAKCVQAWPAQGAL